MSLGVPYQGNFCTVWVIINHTRKARGYITMYAKSQRDKKIHRVTCGNPVQVSSYNFYYEFYGTY
jgi:hypothetical protein